MSKFLAALGALLIIFGLVKLALKNLTNALRVIRLSSRH